MSDSGLSTPANIPADADIEQCLRRVVRDALKKDEEITINLARARTEDELGLDAGFLKATPAWKGRSKEIVEAAVDAPQSPEQPKKSTSKPAKKAGTKRKSDEPLPQKKKRQKKSASPVGDSEEDDDVEEPAETGPKKVVSKSVVKDSDEQDALEGENAKPEEVDQDESALSEPPKLDDEDGDGPATNGNPAVDEESEMSSVIDDPPPKKKRQKKSTSPSESKSKGKATSKPAKAGKELTPDEEEIKRLQGWLLKCGVRKVWGPCLAKFSTSKNKIKHLKKLLEDLGMTGRYSVEKAKQIKEARELADEIEAAKEFNDQWGQKGDGEEEESGGDEEEPQKEAKPKRLRPKGLIDFGDSGDDESE